MHYPLQSNLSTEEGQRPFVEALDHLCAHRVTASWSFVKLIPFAGTIEPETEARRAGKVFPLGSTSMTTASRIYGWNPGVVYNADTFHFEAWRDHWGAPNLINGDALVMRFGDGIGHTMGPRVFIRPVQDLKTFTGQVIEVDEWYAWKQRLRDQGPSSEAVGLTLDTEIVVAFPKVILREWRFFVVAGKVRGCSQYAAYSRRERDANVPLDVLLFAQRMIDLWQPAACFVLDIGETEDGLGIVEVNTLNSSGVYETDMKAVLTAIEDLYESP